MNEYVIVGDLRNYNRDCLVCICGTSLEHANEVLNRMLNNPTESDKNLTTGYTNLRIEEVPEKDCWWNYTWWHHNYN
jgi:hypothetical protein